MTTAGIPRDVAKGTIWPSGSSGRLRSRMATKMDSRCSCMTARVSARLWVTNVSNGVVPAICWLMILACTRLSSTTRTWRCWVMACSSLSARLPHQAYFSRKVQ